MDTTFSTPARDPRNDESPKAKLAPRGALEERLWPDSPLRSFSPTGKWLESHDVPVIQLIIEQDDKIRPFPDNFLEKLIVVNEFVNVRLANAWDDCHKEFKGVMTYYFDTMKILISKVTKYLVDNPKSESDVDYIFKNRLESIFKLLLHSTNDDTQHFLQNLSVICRDSTEDVAPDGTLDVSDPNIVEELKNYKSMRTPPPGENPFATPESTPMTLKHANCKVCSRISPSKCSNCNVPFCNVKCFIGHACK